MSCAGEVAKPDAFEAHVGISINSLIAMYIVMPTCSLVAEASNTVMHQAMSERA